ncbi:uncharacterized protein [Triticum aestivum]|uniref:uncharacterized protein n=1 Tax=Triticum aestivum TaxID=4565 RepID=UPI001D01FF8E|nr:uncharacterized protein LOC123187195 [Triticum aestivum]
MAAPTRALVLAVANAEAASVVVGLAKCADCTRKNIKAEEAFKGLQVAIKCKNVHGDYESKTVGGLDGTGTFSVPLAANLHGTDTSRKQSFGPDRVSPLVPVQSRTGTNGDIGPGS